MDQTFFLNLRVLKRLQKHMQQHHAHALATMVKNAGSPLMHIGGSWEHELQVLQSACVDPREFPVHVLADDKVVGLIKKAQRRTVGSLWLVAVYTVFQTLRNQ